MSILVCSMFGKEIILSVSKTNHKYYKMHLHLKDHVDIAPFQTN